MLTRQRSPQTQRHWLFFEEGTTIRIWVDRSPSLAEWEDILETLHAFLPCARKVALEGRGWESRSGRAIVEVLEDELPAMGIEVAVRALVH